MLNLNFFLLRDFKYVQQGRIQTENESIELSEKIHKVLIDYNIPFRYIKSNYESEDLIIDIIKKELQLTD